MPAGKGSLKLQLKTTVDKAALETAAGQVRGQIDDIGKRAERGARLNLRTEAARAALRDLSHQLFMVGAAATAAFGMAAKTAAQYGDELAKGSQITATSVEGLARLRYAADRSGVSFEELQVALRQQARTANEARQGVATYADTYKRLGVTVTDSSGQLKDGETLFREIAEAISKLPSAMERSAIAAELFGRSGGKLMPLLNQGAEGVDRLGDRAERLGLVMSKSAAKGSEDFNDAWADVRDTMKGSVVVIGQQLLPELTKLALGIANIVAGVSKWSRDHPTLTSALVKGGLAASTFALALGGIVKVVSAAQTLIAGLRAITIALGLAKDKETASEIANTAATTANTQAKLANAGASGRAAAAATAGRIGFNGATGALPGLTGGAAATGLGMQGGLVSGTLTAGAGGAAGVAAGGLLMGGSALAAGYGGFHLGAGQAGREYLYGGEEAAGSRSGAIRAEGEANRLWQYRRFVESFQAKHGRKPELHEMPPSLLAPGQRAHLRASGQIGPQGPATRGRTGPATLHREIGGSVPGSADMGTVANASTQTARNTELLVRLLQQQQHNPSLVTGVGYGR